MRRAMSGRNRPLRDIVRRTAAPISQPPMPVASGRRSGRRSCRASPTRRRPRGTRSAGLFIGGDCALLPGPCQIQIALAATGIIIGVILMVSGKPGKRVTAKENRPLVSIETIPEGVVEMGVGKEEEESCVAG